MSSNAYYSGNLGRNDGHNYSFNEIPQCPSGSEQSNNILSSRIVGSGVDGPGTRVEETTPSISSVSNKGRGKRKQRKKVSATESRMGEQMKMEQPDDSEGINLNDTMAGVHEVSAAEEVMYCPKPCPDVVPPYDSNMLDQILSYKKMLLLQSPEVMEFLKRHQLNK